MLRKTPVALALGVVRGLTPLAAWAQETPSPQAAEVPGPTEITVSATRTLRRVDDVPATVTVVPADAIEKSGARDIKDVFHAEIDVTVRSAPTRFNAAGADTGRAGNEGINIRGLEGNQVLLLVDGIRVPNSFSFGSFATGRGDFFSVDGVQTIEVLRGPASTQYGSDGLAGAVSLRTLAPADLLKRGRDSAGFARVGYASVDHSSSATMAAAVRRGPWQALVLASARRGHETDNKGTNDAPDSTRTTPNPLDYRSPYVLAKALLSINTAHQVGVTLESLRRTQDTEVISARSVPPLVATSTLDLDAHDRVQRDRVSLEHRFDDPKSAWMQKAETRVYAQDGRVRQIAAEDRNTAADRTRDNSYRQRLVGLSTQLESSFSAGLDQHLSYGLDWSQADITGVRDGTVPPPGEAFPTKPFPDTRYTLVGAFVQDEIESGAFSIVPGLRFDRYKLDPSAAGYTGGAVAALSDQAVTPRMGVVWRLASAFAPYAQWAKGFRAPTPDQVNNGFTNLAFGYKSVGNPNLKAERADSFELGLRGRVGAVRYSAAAYNNRYRDFISQQVVGGSGTPADPLIFQYINLNKARIRGIELRGEWRIDPRWTASAGAALARGQSEANGTTAALDTVEPMRTALGIRYDAGRWDVRAQLLHSQGKAADRIAPASATPYAPQGYTMLDLGATWKPMPRLSLVANLNNVFDTKYWRWSDVRGLADASSVKDAYTAPGRSVQVSARYDF